MMSGPSDALSLSTGIPSGKKKPTRRGGRSGHSLKTHTDNAHASLAAGDHKAAQSHLFKAIGALRAQSMATPSSSTASTATDDEGAESLVPQNAGRPAVQPLNGLAKLAGVLRSRKTT